LGVDGEIGIERDAIIPPRRIERDVAADNVLPHPMNVALERVAPAPTTSELHAEEIAALEQ
jgi:hypothetical protein